MTKRIYDIDDDQIRVLGQKSKPVKRVSLKPVHIICLFVFLLLVAGGIFLCIRHSRTNDAADNEELQNALFEPETAPVLIEPVTPLGDYTQDTINAYTEYVNKTINDIVLDIYIPHNALPELCIGVPDIHDSSIVLTTQAADVRADNGKIVGAFVLKGKPIAWGLSKKGYCAVIDSVITVGIADNTPKFEEATEKKGYFFRQFPLVDSGKIVEVDLKGKSIRKAICDRGGEIFIVMTQTPESFHDFSQALVDLRVDNAIYLVGSQYSYGFFRDGSGTQTHFCKKIRGGRRHENFILWRSKQ